MSDDCEKELNSSDLGTLDFWERTYSEEINNYKDHGDVGEVWFGEDNSQRIIRYISEKSGVDKNDKIIDIGCGNGMLLIGLAKEGFTNLLGVDYSKKAIDLAAKIVEEKNFTAEIKILVYDILHSDENQVRLESDYKIVHDKGTYDAISLCPDNPKEKREKYIENIHRILNPSGCFILTSCNWTKEELVQQFNKQFELIRQLPSPSFQFGGKSGNTVTQLVFKKK